MTTRTQWLGLMGAVIGAINMAALAEEPAKNGEQREHRERREHQVLRDRERSPLDRQEAAPPRIDRLFGALDANGDGRIDREELGDRLPGILRRLGEAEGPARPADAKRGPADSGPHPGPALMEQLQRRLDKRIEQRVKEILEKRLPELIDRKLREARMRVRPDLPGRGPEARPDRAKDVSAFRPPGRGLAPADGAPRGPLAGPRSGIGDRPARPEAGALRGLRGRAGGRPGFRRPGAGPVSRGPAAGQMAFRMLDANGDGRLQVEEIRRLIGLLDQAAAESERQPMTPEAWQKLLGEHRPPKPPGPRPEPK